MVRKKSWFSAIAPGILIAATGVGAGDLITASLAGSKLGIAIVWAAAAGALLKWFLNEGIARWQMATDTTLLEGWNARLGAWIRWVFLLYLVIWSFVVGGAMVTACGVAGNGLFRLSSNLETSKMIWGCIHSFVGLILVWVGGFKVFERLMSVCIGIMFVTVLLTAVMIEPDWNAVGRGLVVPTIPDSDEALGWILGVLGGVGGTVTLLCYGYWIREADRQGREGLRACRLDLAIGYTMTALFGIAMIIIGSRVSTYGYKGGAAVALMLASQLEMVLGESGRWVFLVGFWGAVFSSLLGVWQSVPYLFADFLSLHTKQPAEVRARVEFTKTTAYRVYLLAIALIPLILLRGKVAEIQLAYAVLGALFMPLLALTLLIMNTRKAWVGAGFVSGWLTNLMLVVTIAFFAYQGFVKINKELQPKETAPVRPPQTSQPAVVMGIPDRDFVRPGSEDERMLEMRPNCECCNKDLPPASLEARICSHECTFCSTCTEQKLKGKCPNCNGTLLPRPTRSKTQLARHPASTVRIYKPEGCE